MSDRDQYTMLDPTTAYPVMNIDGDDHQPEPGLDGKLQPQADHGEKTYRGSGRLTGRKALITGGDSGIGRAVAIAFAREGADVVIGHLPDEDSDAHDVVALIREAGRVGAAIAGDVSDEAFCQDLVERSVKELGGLDIIVNNAGKQVYVDDIEQLSTEQLEKTFRTNVFAMFWIVKAALPHLPAGASIINSTSIQSYQPSGGLLDYASTKGAITSFTHGLAQQLASKGIRVNGVAPGPIWTPLQPTGGQPPEALETFGQDTPLGRPGQPAELAPAYVYLASGESSYVTAEIIGVTGGNHLP